MDNCPLNRVGNAKEAIEAEEIEALDEAEDEVLDELEWASSSELALVEGLVCEWLLISSSTRS